MKDNFYISIRNVSKYFKIKNDNKLFSKTKNYLLAVNNLSIDLQKGEILGIIGESGCGKSTLAKIIVNLEKQTLGEIFIDGISKEKMLRDNPKRFRREVQMIFQNPYDSFNPRDKIETILMRVLEIHNIGENYLNRKELLIRKLEEGGLKPANEILTRYPHQLSGGQLQRISIIRAMLLEPKLLIADEPVSMLDMSVRSEIINMLLDLSKKNNMSLIFISHDISLTRNISDKIGVMYFGNLVEYGCTDDVIYNPMHPYTRVLISNTGSINPKEVRNKLFLSDDMKISNILSSKDLEKFNKGEFNSQDDFKEIVKNHWVKLDKIYKKEKNYEKS